MTASGLSCAICAENKIDSETHFGVTACRACAAFFRRSVAHNRVYRCRRDKTCVISAVVRSKCRSCRLAKCLSVGMQEDAVQKFRDIHGQRERASELDKQVPSTINFLNILVEKYTHIESIRHIAHYSGSGDSVFTTRKPKALTYKEATRISSKECDLIADCIINTYPEFAKLPEDQKTILFNNFFLPFIILQDSYFSCLQNRSDIIILANGDYIDCQKPETFYHDPEGGQTMSPEDAVKMFAPAFANYRRNLTDPMLREGVNKHEFLALVSLILFDPGLEGQTEECVNLCRKYRETIHREILNYYQTVRNVPDPPTRLAFLLSLLPALQRATRRFQQDVEISKTFNVYAVDENFYAICRG